MQIKLKSIMIYMSVMVIVFVTCPTVAYASDVACKEYYTHSFLTVEGEARDFYNGKVLVPEDARVCAYWKVSDTQYNKSINLIVISNVEFKGAMSVVELGDLTNVAPSKNCYKISDGVYGFVVHYGSAALGTTNFEYASEGDILTFNSYAAAQSYLATGDIDKSAVTYNPDIFEYDEQIYLEDFDIEIHSSNKPENWYIRFYYKPSEFMAKNLGVCDVKWSFEGDIEWLLGMFDFDKKLVGEFELDFSNEYIDIYPSKILKKAQTEDGRSISYWYRAFSGEEAYIVDFENIPIDFGEKIIGNITKSIFYFSFEPNCQGVSGNKFRGYVDCLDNNNSYTSFEKPIFENDVPTDEYETVYDSFKKVNGYYYTDVDEDGYGNAVYNYFFINNRNISTEISSDGSGDSVSSGDYDINLNGKLESDININLNDSESDSDILINDDDYKDDVLIDNMTNLFGLVDDMETAKEDDGALTFLKDFFGVLPGDISGMVGYGVGTVTVVAIIRAFLRR